MGSEGESSTPTSDETSASADRPSTPSSTRNVIEKAPGRPGQSSKKVAGPIENNKPRKNYGEHSRKTNQADASLALEVREALYALWGAGVWHCLFVGQIADSNEVLVFMAEAWGRGKGLLKKIYFSALAVCAFVVLLSLTNGVHGTF